MFHIISWIASNKGAVNIMAADTLATLGAAASAGMVLS